jgi:hypothetical protein
MPEYVFSPEVREASEKALLWYLREWTVWFDEGPVADWQAQKDWAKVMQTFPAYEIRDILSRVHDAKESS